MKSLTKKLHNKMQLIAITLYGIQSDRSQQTLLVDVLGLPVKTVEATCTSFRYLDAHNFNFDICIHYIYVYIFPTLNYAIILYLYSILPYTVNDIKF